MGVDYMTRWAEATTSARIIAKEVAKFVYESICCTFGVPLEILSDRGPGFRGGLVGELMKKLRIERRHSTPYYPQCNGLVEKVNGMICKIITKQVVSKPKDWDKHLSAALWAYRTSLGYTPYHLVFGKEAILPIEVQLASLKILATKIEETPSDRLKQRILDLERLELDREMAIEHYATQAERRRQKFNKGLKDKELKRDALPIVDTWIVGGDFNNIESDSDWCAETRPILSSISPHEQEEWDRFLWSLTQQMLGTFLLLAGVEALLDSLGDSVVGSDYWRDWTNFMLAHGQLLEEERHTSGQALCYQITYPSP
ncbi:hypothetical protein L7F22_012636 [Adiantum nelumboides]|nr:hypothetical protein [Adiantum nelumboides]